MIVAHSYVLGDAYIGQPVIDYLKGMEVTPIRADVVDRKEALKQSAKVSKTLKWELSREPVSYTQLPERLMQTIEEGMKETKGQYQLMVDRKEAMRFMLAQGRPGDILILAGKGHEQYQEIKGDYLPFNERKIAQEILADLD